MYKCILIQFRENTFEKTTHKLLKHVMPLRKVRSWVKGFKDVPIIGNIHLLPLMLVCVFDNGFIQQHYIPFEIGKNVPGLSLLKK